MSNTVHLCSDCFYWKTRCGLIEAIVLVFVRLTLKSDMNFLKFLTFLSILMLHEHIRPVCSLKNLADVLRARFNKLKIGIEYI